MSQGSYIPQFNQGRVALSVVGHSHIGSWRDQQVLLHGVLFEKIEANVLYNLNLLVDPVMLS